MDDPSFLNSDPASPPPGTLPAPVPTRTRHDGWTPRRQRDFIAALAETGCVVEAAATVKMTPRSAYLLRVRADANIFRQAWDIALDFAIRNLSEVALSRCINGVARPVYHKGEQVGERRYYDERLTQFLLRYRDPVRFGVWRDSYEARRHPDGAGIVLANALNVLDDVNHGVDAPVDRAGIELPLAEGPPSASEPVEEPVTAQDWQDRHPHWTPEMCQLRAAMFRKSSNADDPTGDGGEQADWRDPLTAYRPREKGR